MSTRKLILTALVCGLAIMLAGGFKLLQVAREDVQAEVLALGVPATLGDMTVQVDAVEQSSAATVVTVTMSGVEGADAVEGWRLLVDGAVTGPLVTDPPGYGTTCGTTSRCMRLIRSMRSRARSRSNPSPLAAGGSRGGT